MVRGSLLVRKVWVDDDGNLQWEIVDAALSREEKSFNNQGDSNG